MSLFQEHIGSLLLVEFQCGGQTVVQEAHIDTEVVILHGLPLDVRIGGRAYNGSRGGLAVDYIIRSANGGEVGRIVDRLVADLAPAEAEFQVGEDVLRLHKFLARYPPSGRYCGECGEFLAFGKLA